MTASAVWTVSPTLILNGLDRKSTEPTAVSINFVPNFSACFLIFCIKSGPPITSGKPGKFSTWYQYEED